MGAAMRTRRQAHLRKTREKASCPFSDGSAPYVRPARILCLSNEDKRTIFSNIENLLLCNQALLERLGAAHADGRVVERRRVARETRRAARS